jgi:hypothetical protein
MVSWQDGVVLVVVAAAAAVVLRRVWQALRGTQRGCATGCGSCRRPAGNAGPLLSIEPAAGRRP